MSNRKSTRYALILLMFLAVFSFLGSTFFSGSVQAASAKKTKTKQVNMIKAARKNKVTARKATLVKKKGKLMLRYKNRKRSERYAKREWVCYRNKIYYFNKNGYAAKGFFKYKKNWYYADNNGVVQYRRWLSVGGKSYYLKKNGIRATKEEILYRKITYKFNKQGVMVSSRGSTLKYLFVGDSRTVGMSQAEGISHSVSNFIGKVGAGYSYLSATAGPSVRRYLAAHPNLKVVFNFGVNDLANIDSYIAYYRSLIPAYPRATFYFMSVNPTYSGSTNARIASFNARLSSAFGSRYVDVYRYLANSGYASWDGIHYTYDTYRKIYNYTISKIR